MHSKADYKLLYPNKFVVFSPECFVKIRDGMISTYPMKGTIDAQVPNASEKILSDPKETAEHATVVDLLRNDLSIVATKVKIEKFRFIQKIETNNKKLLQVSSHITGVLPAEYLSNLGDIIFKLLPAGSISGAPKEKTLEIIKAAEQYDRGYFTGIFGLFDGTSVDSAVMIRYIEKHGDDLWFKSGGGITAKSNLEKEYQELIDKVYVPFV